MKLRNFVTIDILIQVYYSIIYSLLIYGVLVWGNTYKTNIEPLVILQKKAIRVISFSPYWSHTSHIFKKLNLLKFPDIINVYTALFMLQYSQCRLPVGFDDFFPLVNNKHQYRARLASKSTFYLPSVRTNYGIFNIRFSGPKIWNTIDETLKPLCKSVFKRKLKEHLIGFYYLGCLVLKLYGIYRTIHSCTFILFCYYRTLYLYLWLHLISWLHFI